MKQLVNSKDIDCVNDDIFVRRFRASTRFTAMTDRGCAGAKMMLDIL